MITQVSPNNYEIDLSGEKVRIGSATSSFSPVICFNRWGTESYVELNLIGRGNIARFNSSTLNPDGSVTTDNTSFTLTYKSTGIKPGFNELGGIDYILTLKKNPRINVLTFTYNHQNANAYLQPPLTPEKIARGDIRPAHIVNSIAFYGNSNQVNNKYKTGKIGHLYRLMATDNIGNVTWCDWGFGGGQSQITLTINQTWLNNAVYPVTIAPVGDFFGYDTIGGSSFTLTNYIFSLDATGAVGTGVSISAAVKSYSEGKMKCALYDSNIALVDNGLTAEVDVPDDYGDRFIECNFISAPTLAVETYSISVWGNVGNLRYDGTDNTIHYESLTYGDWPSSIGAWDWTSTSDTISIYCTYEAAAGWSHKYLGVANASIGKINSVAIASILKVNGVA